MISSSKLRVFWKKYGPVLLATGASQFVMGVSTLLFWVLGPEGADVYTVGIQVGNLSFTGFVLGVVYLVVVGRPNFKHWNIAGLAAIVLSLIASIAGLAVVIVAGNTNNKTADMLAISFFGIGGAALAFQGLKYVRLACLGNPKKLAAATLVPNLALLFGLLAVSIFRLSGNWAIILPAMLWMLGAVVLLLDRKPAEAEYSESEIVDENTGLSFHFAILIVGLFTSNFMPFIYMHTLSSLSDGTIAFGFLLIRITSSAIYLISSSVLLVRFNWIDNKVSKGRHEAKALAATTLLIIVCITFASLDQQSVALASAILALAIGLFISSTLLRELNFVKKNKPLLFKVAVDLIISSFAAYALFLNPSVLGLFAVYLISQVITIMISSWGLGFRKVSALSFFCLILSCGLLAIR